MTDQSATPSAIKPRTRALARVAVMLVAIGFACGVAELILRLRGYRAFQWSDRVNTQIVMATDNIELPYVLVPGAEGWGWDTQVAVNSHGFRDREFSEAKGGRFRIAAIGDSITFGSRLPASAVYPKQLEALLQTASPSLHAEVLNFGVTGYDVVNNVEHLRVRALTFRPDIVVLGFCVNDIGTSSTALEYVKAAKYISNPLFRLRLPQFLLSSVLRLVAARESSAANDVDAFQHVNQSRILPIADDPALLQRIDQMARLDDETPVGRWWIELPRIGFLEYAFTRLMDLKRDHGFEVVVVAFPRLQQRNKERWRLVHDVIRHESLKFGFQFVDVFDEFESAGLTQLRNEPQDPVHPNAAGHAIVAQELYDHLVGARLLPLTP